MADIGIFNPKSPEEAVKQIKRIIDEFADERLAGAKEGDVFSIDNETDVLTLAVSDTGGIDKTDGELSVLCDPDGPMSTTVDGLDIALASAAKKGACPTLSDVATQFLNGQGAWTVPATAAWPIGSVFLSVVATSPATLLGFGTWSQIAQGQFLVGYKTGDTDFGTVEGTGGNKDHTHDVDVASTTSGAPSATVQGATGTDITAGSSTHTHAVDPASVTSGNNSELPPYLVVYVWKRTA